MGAHIVEILLKGNRHLFQLPKSHIHYNGVNGWRYTDNYQRDETQNAWLTEETNGPIIADGREFQNSGRINLVGHDLVFFIRGFLRGGLGDASSAIGGVNFARKWVWL